MMSLCCKVLTALEGKSLVTAESCTGGMIGQLLTAVPGASSVYKGGVVSYCNEVKHDLLGVEEQILKEHGAVSAATASAMAFGVRKLLNADVAVSVTGLAGPGGDEYGNPVGAVFVGYSDAKVTLAEEYHFAGDRDAVREQAAKAALELILKHV